MPEIYFIFNTKKLTIYCFLVLLFQIKNECLTHVSRNEILITRWNLSLKTKWLNKFSSVLKVVHHTVKCEMELFHVMRKIYKMMGILSPSQNYPINLKNLIILSPTILFCVSSMVFLLFRAKTIEEYADSVYFTASAIIAICMFSETVWKNSMTFDLVEKFENIVQKSISNSILIHSTRK